jgi:uncharacterized membrane protein YedE/YeeE
MEKNVSALIAGAVFGLGLTISQMIDPQKVLAFLDVFGGWDPSLAFVMGGALVVTAVGYRFVWRRARPVFADGFQLPTNTKLDARLAIGAIMFGVGWGLVGLCPGPAIAGLLLGGGDTLLFVGAMLAGFYVFERSPFNR